MYSEWTLVERKIHDDITRELVSLLDGYERLRKRAKKIFGAKHFTNREALAERYGLDSYLIGFAEALLSGDKEKIHTARLMADPDMCRILESNELLHAYNKGDEIIYLNPARRLQLLAFPVAVGINPRASKRDVIDFIEKKWGWIENNFGLRTATEAKVLKFLGSIQIPVSFRDWALGVLREQNQQEAKVREKIVTSHRRDYDQTTKKLDNLIDLRAAGEITPEEFAHRKESLLKEKLRASELLKDADLRVDNWLVEVDKQLTFAEKARSEFEVGDLSKKKEILYALGSNLTLKDKILSVSLLEPLERIKTAAPVAHEVNKRFEPLNNEEEKKELNDSYSQNPVLLRE